MQAIYKPDCWGERGVKADFAVSCLEMPTGCALTNSMYEVLKQEETLVFCDLNWGAG